MDTLHNIQSRIARFTAEHNLETNAQARLLDMVSELGEVAKEMLKGSQYGAQPYAQTPAWEEELADVFFSLLCLANTTKVDLETALEKVLSKYTARLNVSGDAGSGR